MWPSSTHHLIAVARKAGGHCPQAAAVAAVAMRVTSKAQLCVLVESVSLEAAGVGGGEGAEVAGVRDPLVLAEHVLPQLGGVARLVRTAGALVPHLVVLQTIKR